MSYKEIYHLTMTRVADDAEHETVTINFTKLELGDVVDNFRAFLLAVGFTEETIDQFLVKEAT